MFQYRNPVSHVPDLSLHRTQPQIISFVIHWFIFIGVPLEAVKEGMQKRLTDLCFKVAMHLRHNGATP